MIINKLRRHRNKNSIFKTIFWTDYELLFLKLNKSIDRVYQAKIDNKNSNENIQKEKLRSKKRLFFNI